MADLGMGSSKQAINSTLEARGGYFWWSGRMHMAGVFSCRLTQEQVMSDFWNIGISEFGFVLVLTAGIGGESQVHLD
jgi:hypothetical protein